MPASARTQSGQGSGTPLSVSRTTRAHSAMVHVGSRDVAGYSPTRPDRDSSAIRSSSSDWPTTAPAASNITNLGWVICSCPRNDPTLPTKIPRTPCLSWLFHQRHTRSLPKNVAVRLPCPSVRTASRRVAARASALRAVLMAALCSRAITATCSPSSNEPRSVSSVPAR